MEAGITLLGAGSIISKHPNPAQQLKHLNELVKTYET
jgi:hypothetical protein